MLIVWIIAFSLSTAIASLIQYIPWLKGSKTKRRLARYAFLFIAISCIAGIILTIKSYRKSDFTYIPRNQEELYQNGNSATFNKEIEDKSLTEIEKELGEEASERIKQAKEFFLAGQNNLNSFNFQDAIANLQKSVDILSSMSAYLSLGIAYSFLSDILSAEKTFNLGYQLAIKRKSNKFKAAFLGNIGLINIRKNNFDYAIHCMNESLIIHEELNDPQGIALDYGNIGIVYRRKKDFQEGLRNLNKALEEFAKLKDKKGMAIQHGNIGNIYYDMAFNTNDPDKLENSKMLEQAFKKYEEALSLFLDIDYKVGIAVVYRNLGKTSDWLGKFDDALNYYQKSYDYYEIFKDVSQLARLINDKGVVLRLLKRNDEALEAFNKAIELKHDFADAWYNSACTFSIKGDNKNALINLEKAIELDPSLKGNAREDEDLKSLWISPIFKKIIFDK